MCWRTVVILNLLAIIQSSAQFDRNGTEPAAPRCCPCPVGADAGLAQPGPAQSPQASGGGPGRVGHCPCLARDADAAGAASGFFPNAVRAPGNVLRPEAKEDVKPLLHPEVDLASSVLETLREATDEEYREALARDAARAAPDVTLAVADVTPERDVVTIIVSPQDMETADDSISEASHVQETRCIHSPLGNARASFNYRDPHKGLDEILNLPLPGGLIHRQRDSNLAASDVLESVVRADSSLNRVLSGLKLKTDPSLLNLAPKLDISKNKNKIPSDQIEKKDFDRQCLDDKKVFDMSQRSLDSNWSPSDVETQFVEATDREESNAENLAVMPKNKLSQFPLKNIFKLRDVELVPLDKMIQKSKFNIPNIKLDPYQNKARAYSFDPVKLPKLSDLFGKPSKVKSHESNQNNGISDLTNSEESTNIQAIPKNKEVMTEILDVVPSPSEANHVVSAKENCLTFKPDTEKLADGETGKADDILNSASIETLEPSAEQVSDSIAIHEDNNIISDFNQSEGMESKNDEEIEDSESDGTENIEIIDNQGFDQGTEREIIISQEDISDVPFSSVDLSEINEAKERNNEVAEENQPLKSLEAIRKSVIEKLDVLQNNNRIALDNIKHSVEEISEKDDAIKGTEAREPLANNEEHLSDSDLESSPLINVNADELKDVSASTEEVSIHDLQNMSDSILIASEKNQQDVLANNIETEEHEIIASQTIQSEENFEEANSDSEDNSESEIDKVLGMDEADKLESKESRSENQINENNTMENTCATDVRKTSATKNSQMSLPDTNENEEMDDDLESHASEPIINSMLKPNSKSQIEQLKVLENNKEIQGDEVMASQTVQSEEQFEKVNSDTDDISEIEINKVLEMDEADQLESKESGHENQINEKNIVENTCATDLRKTSATKSSQMSFSDTNGNEETDDEMSDLESHASEPIINSMLRPNSKSLIEHLSNFESKLRQNLIVQPTPLINTDDLNIFQTPALSIPDISDLNSNIPTLEEIRARVSEILGGLARHADDEDVSFEVDSDDFASNLNPVLSTDFSSPLQPLKDINLDIIQLKPLPLTSGINPLKAEFPGLNLNTYKAKLAVPRTLDLKPLKLASTLGNDGGLVGATLSIEPEKKLKVGKSKVKAKLNPNLRHSGQNSLINYPALADVTASVQKNAQNLLNIPKKAKGQTLQVNNAISDIADNLKFHTDSTIKNIHQTLNPPCLDDINSNIKKNAKHLLNSGRNTLETFQSRNPVSKIQSSSPMKEAVDSLNAQSENAFRNVKQTISTPSLAINNSIRRQNSIPPLEGVVNNLRSQTESVMKNVQQNLKVPDLSNINNSIQKSAQTAVLRSSLQPSIPLDTVMDNLKSQTQSTMKNIQKSLSTPTLSDISATVQKHAQDLKLSPVAITGRDAFGNVLQASAPIDLKPHTEKAVKDLQKTLKATLKNSPIKHLQPLPNHNHVVQMITDHQEDVSDKLFAIHTDLNDRLESMHNEIMDPDRLRSILSPPSNRHFELFAIPLPNSRMTAPKVNKQMKPALRNKQPSLGTQRNEFRKPTVPKISKPKPGTTKLGLIRVNADKERNSPKSFKMASAASAPAPVHTHRQILPAIPKKPTILKPLERSSLKKPLSQPSSPKGLEVEKKPFLPKDKPLTQNKFTLGSTTLRPNLATPVAKTNKIIPTTAKPKTDNKRFKPKPPVRQPTPWNGWGEARTAPKLRRVGDPQTSPTHPVPKVQSPLKSNSPTAINKAIKTETLPRLSSVSSRLKPETLKKPKPNLKLSVTQGKTSNPDSQLSVTKPKNSLLSKLTEALKSRQAKANLTLPSEMSSPDLDMGAAPSEHVEKAVAFGEPIKENVSYKCKMMCVKVDNLQD